MSILVIYSRQNARYEVVDGQMVLSEFDAWIAALTLRAFALKDVCPVCTVFVITLQALQSVCDLSVIGSSFSAMA